MTLNCFGHDPHNTYIVDIESDDLSAKYNSDTRVYLVGCMNVASSEYTLYPSVTAFNLAVGNLSHTYVFHNASFDVPALRLRGVTVEGYYCTMVGSHTLHPESSEYHSLGSLQPDVKKSLRDLLTNEGYNFTGVKKGEEYSWYRGNGSRLDTLVEDYLVRDLTATRNEYLRQVREYSTDDVPTAKLLTVLLEVNVPYVERIIDMETGVRITYNDDVANVLSEATDRSMEACLSIAGYVGNPEPFPAGRVPFVGAWFKSQGDFCKMELFNPNSGQQVARKLTELYGWEPTQLTKGGAACTSSEVLESLDYPLCEHLLEYGKSAKLLSFCGALRESNGWIRPSYNQCATRTTRLSASKPNVQQIPARDEVGKQLRKLFTARDGYTLLVGDQSGFQLRIVAAYMSYYFGDGRLAECFNRGEDVHQFFADIYGIDRKPAKNVTFGWLFGAGVSKMTATANRGNPNPIKESVIRGALNSLKENMPAMPGVKELLIESAHANNGVIHDWLGTRYVVPELLSKDRSIRASGERKVCNYMVQGFESSLFRHLQNKAACYVDMYGGRQALVVHDEVGYEVPCEVAEYLRPQLNTIMSPAFSEFTPEVDDVHGLRLECEFNTGGNWYDAKGE
jgi:DNA polymerase family A